MKVAKILAVFFIVAILGIIGVGMSQACPVCQGNSAIAEEALFSRIQRTAEQGDANVQFQLGAMYEYGILGAPKDTAMAATWYRKAAEQGYNAARVRLNAIQK